MKFVAGIAVGLLASLAWAQNDNELTARQLFLNTPPASPQPPAAKKPQPPKVKPPDAPVKNVPEATISNNVPKVPDTPTEIVRANYAPLALKYSILQRKGSNFAEVNTDSGFHSGDRIRLRVETNSTGYLYIVLHGSSGQWQVLFPSKEIDDGNNRIEAGQVRTIPFYFDETPGIENLSLVLTRSPEHDFEKLIYAAGDPARQIGQPEKTIIAMNHPIDDSVVIHVRGQVLARDLVFEKCDGTTPDCPQEKAVYAATKDKSSDARLFVDLKLVHK